MAAKRTSGDETLAAEYCTTIGADELLATSLTSQTARESMAAARAQVLKTVHGNWPKDDPADMETFAKEHGINYQGDCVRETA